MRDSLPPKLAKCARDRRRIGRETDIARSPPTSTPGIGVVNTNMIQSARLRPTLSQTDIARTRGIAGFQQGQGGARLQHQQGGDYPDQGR